MITITGEFILNKGAEIIYLSPKTAEIPHIFPNFEGLTVDFILLQQQVDNDGLPVFDEGGNPVFVQVAIKGYSFTSADLASEDVQIQQTLDKLRDTVEKKISKDLQTYNPDAVIKVEKNGNKK